MKIAEFKELKILFEKLRCRKAIPKDQFKELQEVPSKTDESFFKEEKAKANDVRRGFRKLLCLLCFPFNFNFRVPNQSGRLKKERITIIASKVQSFLCDGRSHLKANPSEEIEDIQFYEIKGSFCI